MPSDQVRLSSLTKFPVSPAKNRSYKRLAKLKLLNAKIRIDSICKLLEWNFLALLERSISAEVGHNFGTISGVNP